MLDKVWSFTREHLVPPLTEAVNMIRGIPKDISEIKDELEIIQAFINKADRMAETEEDNTPDGIKKKVKLHIEVAFRMEDVIDEYMICEERQPRDPGCAALLCDPIKIMILRLQIANKIKDIKSQAQEIKERSGREGSQIQSSLEQEPSSSGENQDIALENLRMSPLYIEESDVVGFEFPKDKLVNWLVRGRVERTIITLEGMGGRGKTTLAKKVFDNIEVIKQFDCHAWVTASQTYTRDGLLRNMLKEFYKEKKEELPSRISEMHGESLIKEVRGYLHQKRYVVFFDDVWNECFWDMIELAFIDNKNGSRILITTRMSTVARCCQKTSLVQVHKMELLTSDQCLELFYKKAFRFDLDGRCPTDLVDISSEIIDRCFGLPLAIVAIGGLLSGKGRDPLQWKLFSQQLSSELGNNPYLNPITKILGFSYHDLPNSLKPCLLYFGMFPEHYEIKPKRLIRQWVAEGFVKHVRGKTPEVVAAHYLTELINRSLVHVSSFSIDGKARRCYVHDLSFEMILQKIKDLSFCHYISEDHNQSILSGLIRRLSITTGSDYSMGHMESSHIRSLFFFTEKSPDNFVCRILTRCKLAKVLDFGEINHIPENWGNFINLRYLSFSMKNSSLCLPASIGELQNLETLDLRHLVIRQMPREISKLTNLRHLLTRRMYLAQLKDGIGGMTFLQTLRYVDIGIADDDTIRELGMLKQLKELRLTGVCEKHGSALCSSINQMQQLEKLHIESTPQHEVIDLHSISSPPLMLQKLSLIGKLNEMPKWVTKLQHLVKLSLKDSRLSDDPLKSLQNMANLLFLYFGDYVYEGESLHFEDGGFQKLKELYLSNVFNLNSILIDEGALQSLKKLQIYGMPKLKTIPSGISYLKKLDVFEMDGVEDKSIETDEGQEHPIFKHVELVRIYTGRERELHIFPHSRN